MSLLNPFPAGTTACLTLCEELPFNHALSKSHATMAKEKEMALVSKLMTCPRLFRKVAVVAVVIPAALAACAQQPPPPPPAPVQAAPPPAPVPAARG
jgi:hypothetical protein